MRKPATSVVVCLLLVLAALPLRADSPWLYGIHWWGHWEGQPVDSTPCTLLDCTSHGGWTLETVLTHSDHHWRADFFVPLYQDLYTTKNISIVTRIDYKWGETVPSPTGPDHAVWPNVVVAAVNKLSPYCHLWQIGNEPNVTVEGANWPANRIDPAGYAAIYRNVRNAIRASAAPSPAGPHRVLIAGTSPGGAAGVRWMSGHGWLGEVLDAIPDDEIDGVAIHSYGGTVASFRSSYATLLNELTVRGLHHVPVYLTEWNLRSSEAAMAQFCREAFADVNAWNLTPGNHNIVAMMWFVYDANQQAGGTWNVYSIEYFRNNGIPLGDPDNLFTAFQHAVAQRYRAGAEGNPGFTSGFKIGPGSVAVAADSFAAGFAPDRAIDGGLATLWKSNPSPGAHWLQIDLGLHAPVTGFQVWHAGSGGASTSLNSRAFTIESAPMPSGPWSVEFIGSNPSQDNVNDFSYEAPRTLRHLRLTITDPGSDAAARVVEWEVLADSTVLAEVPTGQNVAPASPLAQASSVYGPAWGPEKAIDGVISDGSKWTSADVSPPHTLTLDLGAAKPVSGVILRQPSAAGENSGYNIRGFLLQSARSLTGSWFTESGGVGSEAQPLSALRFVSPKDLRYVRLVITAPGIDKIARVPEFEVYSTSGPIAVFSAVPTSGHVPLAVSFTDQSVGQVTGWEWHFGDGAVSDLQHPSHIYVQPGAYSVRLTVTGPEGDSTLEKLNSINVLTVPPDFDRDGDVDQEDFAHLQTCFSGPGLAQTDPACFNARLDDDHDVDADDFSLFQACFGGPGIWVDPECFP